MGKTSLALALAQDEAIQASFPDGIFWGTLGEDPNPLAVLGRWLKQLDPQGLHTPTLALASEQLRHAVKTKKLLLIIDDLWELEDLTAFRVVAGTASRLLVTTRDVDVPQSEVFALGEMSGTQSLQLFESYLKQSLEQTNRKDALQFAKSVGYLPLSLRLGASQIRNGFPWSQLNATIQKSVVGDDNGSPRGLGKPLSNLQNLFKLGHLKEAQHQGRQACLKLCLDQLEPELRLRLATLSLFPRDLEISPKMASTVWRLSIADSRQRLQQLKLKGFLSHGKENPEQGQSYCLHPVIRDMGQWLLSLPAKGDFQGLGLSWPRAHQQFLERYRSQLENNQWYTIPNDGYIHPNFLWHLEQAGWIAEIHQLLQSFDQEGRNAWFAVCDRLGLESEFRVDLAKAWQLAKTLYPDAPEYSMGLQVRYALTSTFLRETQDPNSSSENGEAPQKRTLLSQKKNDRLEEDWAFTHVLLQASRYLPDLATKVIKSTYYPSSLDDASKEETVYELLKNVHQESPDMALELTQHVLPSPTAIAALSRLLPNHPTLCLPLLNLVENASQAESIAEGAMALVKQPEHKLHPELFNLLPKLRHPLDQVILLDQFKHRLPDILQPKVKAFRRKSLAALKEMPKGRGYLSFDETEVLSSLDRATLDYLEQRDYHGEAIVLCFEEYPSPLLEAVYEKAMASRSEAKRSKTLAFLIPKLSEKHRRAIWSIYPQFIAPECKTRLLVSLLPYRTEALKPLLELLRLFENQTKLEFLMGSLPAPAAIVREIYKTLRAVSQPSDRWAYLVKLLPYVNRDLEHGFLEVLEEMPYETEGMLQLVRQVQPQQKTIQAGIVNHVANIPPVFERANALRDITPFLKDDMKLKALEVAQQIQFPYAKVVALQNFIPLFPELGQDAVSALRNCHQESPDDIYEALIPSLPMAQRTEAMALMNAIADESSQLTRMLRILPYQPDLLPQAKYLARNQTLELSTVLEELHRICSDELADHSPQTPQTLERIQSTFPLIDYVYQSGTQTLSTQAFSPLLEQYFASVGNEIIPSVEQLTMLMDFFYLIPPEPQRAQTLSRLITLVTDQQTISPEQWMIWLEKIARFRPHEFHWMLSSLLKSLMSFSDASTLKQILQAIRSVRAQWATY